MHQLKMVSPFQLSMNIYVNETGGQFSNLKTQVKTCFCWFLYIRIRDLVSEKQIVTHVTKNEAHMMLLFWNYFF